MRTALEAPRLASLDAFRGFAIASMVLVNNPGDWSRIHAPLRHAEWNGWTFTDTVFPFFLFVAGVSMAISVARRRAAGDAEGRMLADLARRAAVIFAVGLALNFIPEFSLATVRIPGVLQRIALCILVAAPFVVLGGARAVAAGIVALFVAYTVPMLAVAVPSASMPAAAGALEPGRDFGAWIDRQVFGPHLWAQSRTWDPEGLVSTLPAAATLLLGVLAGWWLQQPRSAAGKARGLAFAGAVALAAGLVLHRFLMPINKNLWTPSYAVFMAGLASLALAGFYALMDAAGEKVRERARRLAAPLTLFGMNALFLFAFSGLVARLLGAVRVGEQHVTLKSWLYAPFRASPLSPENASLAWAIAFSLAMLVVAWTMWRRRWFIKA
jgi:predicted acyltransferase